MVIGERAGDVLGAHYLDENEEADEAAVDRE